MTEAERIAIRVKHYDGVPCLCEACTQRRLNTMRESCPNVVPGAECVDPECTYCRIAVQEGVPLPVSN